MTMLRWLAVVGALAGCGGADRADTARFGADAAPDASSGALDGAPSDSPAEAAPDTGSGRGDSGSVVDAGTGALGDPCSDTSQCWTGLRCWPTHTPISSQDMFSRCTYDCSVSNPTRMAYCEGTLGGTCQSYQTGATDTICVPK